MLPVQHAVPLQQVLGTLAPGCFWGLRRVCSWGSQPGAQGWLWGAPGFLVSRAQPGWEGMGRGLLTAPSGGMTDKDSEAGLGHGVPLGPLGLGLGLPVTLGHRSVP